MLLAIAAPIHAQTPSYFSGTVYVDRDGDGFADRRDLEPGVSGFTVTLDDLSASDPPASRRSTTTDRGGGYGFVELIPGHRYRVRLLPRRGWEQTSRDPFDFVAKAGALSSPIDFGTRILGSQGIPTLGEGASLALTGLLALAGFFVLRRRA